MEDNNIRKWSWTEFILGWINKRFLVFIIITGFVNAGLHNGISDELKKWLIIIWGVVSVIWMLSGAIEKIIANGKLNVEARLGASINKG